jgi:hypothetical protein
MYKSRISSYLLLALAFLAAPVAARCDMGQSHLACRNMDLVPPEINAQLLQKILRAALDQWPIANNYSYGTLRSAYNHGSLVIYHHPDPNLNAYFVAFEGLNICVLLPE